MNRNTPDPARQQAIRRSILDKLDRADPFALPEPSLKVEVNASVRPPVGEAEFDDAILFLQTRGFIASRPDEFDPDNADLVKWRITEIGQNLLNK